MYGILTRTKNTILNTSAESAIAVMFEERRRAAIRRELRSELCRKADALAVRGRRG